jgi:hypothetical protein
MLFFSEATWKLTRKAHVINPALKEDAQTRSRYLWGFGAYFSDQEKLIKKHGSMQKFFDKVVSEEVAVIDAESTGNSQD